MTQHHNDLIRRLRNAAPPAIKGPNLLDEAADRIRELEQELTNANTDWHESETARVHAERLLRELIDIEGPQPGHVEWYRRVRALLGMTETETPCAHNWIPATLSSGKTDDVCTKCGILRSTANRGGVK